MLKQDEKDRIDSYLHGKPSKGDVAWIERYFANSQNNQDLKSFLLSDWEKTKADERFTTVQSDKILDRLHLDIFNNDHSKVIVVNKPKIWVGRFRLAAMILWPLFIAIGIYAGYRWGAKKTVPETASYEIQAPMASRIHFKLPDGTNGWLNSGSSITYSLPFSKNRKITLKGEAWFNVFHNREYPFEIQANHSKVTVLGTSFDLKAYPDEDYTEVILQHGCVAFTNHSNDNDPVILRPSQRLIAENGKLKVEVVNVANYKAWTEGKLVFRGENMKEVVRRLERWYNVKIEVRDPELLNYKFRATFENDPLKNVLKELSMTSPLAYRIIPRQQKEDGSSEKPRVILYKTNR